MVTICHQILIKICTLAPGAVLSILDQVIIPIEKGILRLVTQIKKNQEIERATDHLRPMLRTVHEFQKIPDIETDNKFQEFVANLRKDDTVQKIFEVMFGIEKAY